jgi:hypothetical protein
MRRQAESRCGGGHRRGDGLTAVPELRPHLDATFGLGFYAFDADQRHWICAGQDRALELFATVAVIIAAAMTICAETSQLVMIYREPSFTDRGVQQHDRRDSQNGDLQPVEDSFTAITAYAIDRHAIRIAGGWARLRRGLRPGTR